MIGQLVQKLSYRQTDEQTDGLNNGSIRCKVRDKNVNYKIFKNTDFLPSNGSSKSIRFGLYWSCTVGFFNSNHVTNIINFILPPTEVLTETQGKIAKVTLRSGTQWYSDFDSKFSKLHFLYMSQKFPMPSSWLKLGKTGYGFYMWKGGIVISNKMEVLRGDTILLHLQSFRPSVQTTILKWGNRS